MLQELDARASSLAVKAPHSLIAASLSADDACENVRMKLGTSFNRVGSMTLRGT